MTFFTLPATTPEKQAQIEKHWDNVRAGIHKPQEYDFSNSAGDVSHLIKMHRAVAMTCIKGAAKHAKASIQLAEASQ